MNDEMTSSSLTFSQILSAPVQFPSLLRSQIDHELVGPVLLFVRTSFLSFLVGSLLLLLCSLKLVLPSFLDGVNFLSYGRLFPVAIDLLLYGWAIPGGLALIFWLTGHLSGATLPYKRVLIAATHLWNSALFFGSLALLIGYSTSVPLLEYPTWTSFLLFVAFLLMGLWVIFILKERRSSLFYVSQWYLLTALAVFPWIYGTANMLLTWEKIQGSAQGPIQAWYTGSLIQLWLIALPLAITYYMIPKISGVKIYSYYLVLVGFISLLFFAGWSGLSALLGGPIPAWMSSVGVVSNILLFLPMMAVVLNIYHMFQEIDKTTLHQSPTLRFVAAGMIFYVLGSALSILHAIPFANAILNFTDYTRGLFFLVLLGSFGMTFLGACYYFIPRLTELHWSSSSSIQYHFWLTIIGIVLLISAMTLGGLIEGVAWNDPAISITNIISYAAPFRWLAVLAWGLLLLGFFFFVRLLLLMRWQMIEKRVPNSL